MHGARSLLLLNPNFHLAVDRDLEKLLFAHPTPLRTAREGRRKLRYFVRRENDSMLGAKPLDGLGAGKPIPDAKPLQEHARLPTLAGGRGGPPFAPETNAVV